MVSIEKNTYDYDRYKFNLPYGGIDLLGGTAAERLPELDWSGLNIVWLDYERQLDDEAFLDVSFLCRELIPASLLVVTLNATTPKPRNVRRATLEQNVGEERIPTGTTDDSLGRWGWAAAQRDILLNWIDESVTRRTDGAWFEQLFDFFYADDAEMQTLGGLFLSPGLRVAYENCRFGELEFIRHRGDEPVEVFVPIVTHRERLHLNQQLPAPPEAPPTSPGLTEKERSAYKTFQRWYPGHP